MLQTQISAPVCIRAGSRFKSSAASPTASLTRSVRRLFGPAWLRQMALALVLAGATALLVTAPRAVRADELQDISRMLRAGQFDGALNRADAYLATRPRNAAQVRFLKGLILTEMNRTNDAIAVFQRLSEDFPELPEPYNNLAVLYASQGQFDKARGALEMAIRTHPSYATAHENLGDVYAKLASQAYDRALQLDSANATAQTKLSMIRELVGGNAQRAPGALPPAAPVMPSGASPSPAPANSNLTNPAGSTANPSATPARPATGNTPPVSRTDPARSAAQALAAATPLPSVPVLPQVSAAPPARPPVIAAAPQAAPAPAPATAPAVAAPAAATAKAAPKVESKPEIAKAEAKPEVAKAEVAKAAPPKSAVTPERAAENTEVAGAVQNWARAWSSQDINTYLAAYDRDFQPPRGLNRDQWEKERRARIVGRAKISVTLEDMKVDWDGGTAKVKFRQHYKSDALVTNSVKVLTLSKSNGKWLIKQERTG